MKVAVAVIYDNQNRVLITQRALHAAHGGMWEFPGGKLEAEELPTSALIREIKEEVGIDILEYSFLDEITHNYGQITVHLLVFCVKKFCGEALRCESQLDIRWVELDKLVDYCFPEANNKIIELITKN
ncbi:8-oxo-dGTP diphosphatase MutT [Legionella micdadei]|uniref:8-oxo-dGTP diphosphatase n=1 Tax=Legionella micdadei TaxID=451 RepID=A0A098GFW8_LEGMI|nr:8-oxo-dGTP diphosphatase MutT [Legionella micdadei]ARG97554.1 DNA mismatch repair protein MutT [Legionella micdadei]ARH00133.1 DNA mismatch repair protein MutT [Legionella micdadei]KTD27632.1 Mutator protein MutT [Legionella micdadei]NSL17615.1 8-oxo-dGTP diphosphatase MutT [Legionella micdadei]CEG60882.1 Mutator protein MutT [Legionella micdadei]